MQNSQRETREPPVADDHNISSILYVFNLETLGAAYNIFVSQYETKAQMDSVREQQDMLQTQERAKFPSAPLRASLHAWWLLCHFLLYLLWRLSIFHPTYLHWHIQNHLAKVLQYECLGSFQTNFN